jgi:hypothetical protein
LNAALYVGAVAVFVGAISAVVLMRMRSTEAAPQQVAVSSPSQGA